MKIKVHGAMKIYCYWPQLWVVFLVIAEAVRGFDLARVVCCFLCQAMRLVSIFFSSGDLW